MPSWRCGFAPHSYREAPFCVTIDYELCTSISLFCPKRWGNMSNMFSVTSHSRCQTLLLIHLICTEVQFLGHKVSAGSIEADPDKDARILDWRLTQQPSFPVLNLTFQRHNRSIQPTVIASPTPSACGRKWLVYNMNLVACNATGCLPQLFR